MADFLNYEGRRVVVTGCFSGMGQATAQALVGLGAEVHGFDYKDSDAELASFTRVDLRDPASIDAAVETLGGRVDALFNCAGLPQTMPSDDVMKVNFIGTRYLTEKLTALMGEGSAIASISSNGGLGWSRRVPVLMELLQVQGFEPALKWCQEHKDVVAEGYAFSKELVIVWTMLSSQELIGRGIRTNCIMPGPTQTPMMASFEEATPMAVLDFFLKPIGRRSTPQEQANALILLNSPVSSYVNGVCLPVDGGFMAGLTTGRIDMSALAAAARG